MQPERGGFWQGSSIPFLPAQHRKHLCKSAPKNVGEWPPFLLGRRLWQLGLPTHQTGTAGTDPQPCTRGFPQPQPSSLHPPPPADHRALTSRKTSPSLIISINMQIADVSWAGRVVGKPGNVQKEVFAPVNFC